MIPYRRRNPPHRRTQLGYLGIGARRVLGRNSSAVDVGISPASRTGLILYSSLNDIPGAYLKDSAGEGPYYDANDISKVDGARYNFLFHGDSITVGIGSTDGYVNQFLRLAYAAGYIGNYKNRGINGMGLGYQYTSSSEYPNLTNDAAAAIDVARSATLANRLVIFAGTNDIYLNAKTGAQTYTLLTTYLDARIAAGWIAASEIFVCTMLPRQLITAERQNYNNAIMADAGGRGYNKVALHSNSTIGDDGDQNDATYYADTIHPTNAGAAIIASILKAAMFP